MAGVPYTFSTASQSIPLAQLDSNFATPVTIGSTTVALGQTVTTLANVTLSNVTILSGSATLNNLTGNVTFGNTTVDLGNSSSSIGNLTLINTTINSAAQLSIGTPTQNIQLGGGDSSSLKNRIINGAMVIDQRNAGASGTAYAGYTVDRFIYAGTQASKGTWGQNLNSITPPVGFTNYLGFQSSSNYAVISTDFFVFQQRIEGFNTSDLGFGTVNAKTVTLSFKIYSSLTGTFGGALQNSNGSRSYPFTYSVSVANTWTTVSVTVSGDTSGTWNVTNGIGLIVSFGLGVGSNNSGTAGVWASANYSSATGAVSVVGTNNATFYVTGIQLEVGSQATGFDYRQYGTELALCQRYYETSGGTTGTIILVTRPDAVNLAAGSIGYAVEKRTIPTLTLTNSVNSPSVLTGIPRGFGATFSGAATYGYCGYLASAEL